MNDFDEQLIDDLTFERRRVEAMKEQETENWALYHLDLRLNSIDRHIRLIRCP